jgi:rRNA maturation RNase YbeY
LGCRDRELSILLTGDEDIATLNRAYLGRNGPTNVLAFPASGGPPPRVASPLLGDVVVSLETARRESREWGELLERTVLRLLIHGVLHLLGYDHERSRGEKRKMAAEEDRLLRLVEEP